VKKLRISWNPDAQAFVGPVERDGRRKRSSFARREPGSRTMARTAVLGRRALARMRNRSAPLSSINFAFLRLSIAPMRGCAVIAALKSRFRA